MLFNLLHTYFTLFNMQLHRLSKFPVCMYLFLSCSELHHNKITSIKSDTFNILTNLIHL